MALLKPILPNAGTEIEDTQEDVQFNVRSEGFGHRESNKFQTPSDHRDTLYKDQAGKKRHQDLHERVERLQPRAKLLEGNIILTSCLKGMDTRRFDPLRGVQEAENLNRDLTNDFQEDQTPVDTLRGKNGES